MRADEREGGETVGVDAKCGFSSVNRLARLPVQSVAGIAVPAKEQPYVLEHESGGFYVSMVESGYEPPEEEIDRSLTRAMAKARILACNLLTARIEEARRAAEADLDQHELDLDGTGAEQGELIAIASAEDVDSGPPSGLDGFMDGDEDDQAA